MTKKILLLVCFIVAGNGLLAAQDTVTVSLDEFIKRGIKNAGQIDYAQQNVQLARNRVDEAHAQRYLPQFELRTQHGLVPGVVSNTDRPEDEYYLDPNLENDWENWAIFTRAEVSAIQPIFTWGALRNLVHAAKDAASAAEEQFQAQKAGIALKLYGLYQSYVLTMELQRLLEEAQKTIDRVERQIEEKQETGDPDLDYSEVYKFRIFQSEFAIRIAEVRENAEYIKGVWDYVLQAGEGTVYQPATLYLDPVSNQLKAMAYYRKHAIEERPEVQAVESGIDAAQHGLKAAKAQYYPSLLLGLTGSFAYTPNRPRQDNPFIINNTNYASAGFGIVIRQNLDFFSIKTEVDQYRIQYEQTKYLKDAILDGIFLEVSDAYKNATLSKVSVEKTDEALVTSKRWLRQEQQDYDFGIGETRDLLEAMRKELELRVQLKQKIFEFNNDIAALFKVAGIPLTSLKIKEE